MATAGTSKGTVQGGKGTVTTKGRTEGNGDTREWIIGRS